MTEKPNEYPEVYKLLSTPEAEHLAELYLLQRDLNAAHDTLSLYFEKHAVSDQLKEGEDAIISASLFRDGILLFTSCFSKTDHNKLYPESVYGHLKGWEDYSQKILALRDAFVAHNFGPQRQHSIVIVCPKVKGELIPYAFSQYFIRFAGWVKSEGAEFLSFIDVAREYLKKVIEEVEKPVMAQVMAITPEELAALPDAEVVIPDVSEYRTPRARFRKGGRGSRMPVPQRRLGRTSVGGL